jgi:hypothetical protein
MSGHRRQGLTLSEELRGSMFRSFRMAGKLLFAAAFLLIQQVYAQVSSGTITGTITDSSNARVTGAEIRLTNLETSVASTATSNSSGEYTFPLLTSGRYSLAVEAKGFQTAQAKEILVELGRITRFDFALQVGQVSETMTVTSSAPLLDSESSTVGQFVENKTIADMPLNGRRVGDLMALAGNAVFVTGDVIRPRVAIAGGRADQQQWMLDGVNASNVAMENPQALFNPPVESVQEIRIQQNGYSAEYGNSSSGVILTTTRSGTSKYRGAAYEYLRNDKLDARNFFAAERPPLRWNTFGFTLGGPVQFPKVYNGKNRTFFFTSLEFQRQRLGAVRLTTVPTALERVGNFSATRTAANAQIAIFDPNTSPRTQFAGNIIPENRLDPVGKNFVAFYPLPNRAPTNAAGANNFVANAVNGLNITTWTSKVDHMINDRNRVNVRFLLHDFPTFATAVFTEAAADPNSNRQLRRAYSTMTNWITNIKPAVVNDLRFNWQPRFFNFQSIGLGDGWPTKLGLRGVDDRAFPRVNVTGYSSMGNTQQERIQRPIWDMHLVDGLSWFTGSHSVKFGGEYRWGRNVDILNTAISGSMNFAPQPTALVGNANSGNAAASLLLGFPNSGSTQASQQLDRRQGYYALYIQDDWRLTSSFTLNIGLRWEAHTPRLDANDRQSGFNRTAINPVSGTPGVVTFAGLNGAPRNVYNGDWNNFAPRIGFAWKPLGNGKLVVRSSYGVFFGPPSPGSTTAASGFEIAGNFTTPDNGITAPFLLRNGFPAAPSTANLGPGFGAVRVGQAITFAPVFIDPDRALGYTQQWNLNIQKDLGWNSVLETGYIGTVGRKLNAPNTNINQVFPTLMAAGNAQTRRPFPQFGNVTLIAPMWGNSSYHAMNVKLEKRFSNGFNLLTNYTWSKFIDDVANAFENGNIPGAPQNIYDRRAEKALSGNDVRHRMVLSSVYELPWGPKRKFLNKGLLASVLGGWNLGGIMTLQAGSPIGATTQNNTTNAFTPGAQRANVLRNPELPADQRTVERWFDTSAFALPAPFTFGNASRAVATGPGIINVDMSLIKNFQIKEDWVLQVRAESFNVANRANFDDPGIALGAPNFGVITAARGARTNQLGLKLTF